MLIAVIAAIIAALVVIVAIAVIFAVRQNRSVLRAGERQDLKQVDNMVASDGASPGPDAIHVSRGREKGAKPAENLNGRFAALGVLGVAVFGSLAAKLWSLQVLSGREYEDKSQENLYTTISTPAPRGAILDAQGLVLAKNKSVQAVLADSSVASNRDAVRRLSAVLGLPAPIVIQRINDASAGAQSLRVIDDDARLRDVAFIAEHADGFPDVTVETRTVREYPFGALGAHVLGYTGAPTEDQLKNAGEGRSVESTDTVGLSGVELEYDRLISGDHGTRRMQVDANGNVLDVVSETQPGKGSDIYLCMDARVQYVADTELAKLIAPYGVIGTGTGVAGAAVVMDVRTGGIIAMASYPTFDPTNFTGGISSDIWDLYGTDDTYAPLSNRVVNGQYAAASTYKAFTSLAGLEYGFATEVQGWECTGSWDGFGTGDVQMCWNHDGHGGINLRTGIVQSCDVVFYEIAKAFYDHGPDGTGELDSTALQEYLKKFRLGMPTGIDLSNESSGRIPTPEWKAENFRNRPADAVWRGGDYTNMIIGQGDVLVTPLQIAVAYGGVATGRFMKPHLLKEVRNSQGETVLEVEPEVVAELDVNAEHLAYVRDALRGVVVEHEKIEAQFEEEGVYTAAGKSGTAEHTNRSDDAWYVAYAPYDDPKYVCAVIVEQGGGGSDVAAPLVAKILGETMRVDGGTSERTVEKVAGWSGSAVEYQGASGARED